MVENTDGDWVPVEVCRAIEEQLNSNGGAHAGFSGAVAHWTQRYQSLLEDHYKELAKTHSLSEQVRELRDEIRKLKGLPFVSNSITYYAGSTPVVFVDVPEDKS
jgi:hypothetical protein